VERVKRCNKVGMEEIATTRAGSRWRAKVTLAKEEDVEGREGRRRVWRVEERMMRKRGK
jgi:hypothetical protein